MSLSSCIGFRPVVQVIKIVDLSVLYKQQITSSLALPQFNLQYRALSSNWSSDQIKHKALYIIQKSKS